MADLISSLKKKQEKIERYSLFSLLNVQRLKKITINDWMWDNGVS